MAARRNTGTGNHHQRLHERAHVLWQQEGCPEGRAEELWYQSRQRETP